MLAIALRVCNCLAGPVSSCYCEDKAKKNTVAKPSIVDLCSVEMFQIDIIRTRDSSESVLLSTADNLTVGQKIRLLRRKHGMTQKEFAAFTQSNPTILQKYETNRIPEEKMSPIILLAITQAFNISPNELCPSYQMFLLDNPKAQLKLYRKKNSLTQRKLAENLECTIISVR